MSQLPQIIRVNRADFDHNEGLLGPSRVKVSRLNRVDYYRQTKDACDLYWAFVQSAYRNGEL